MLERVARELLLPSLLEERDEQDPDQRLDDAEFGGQLVTQSSELAGRLRSTMAAFSSERSPLPTARGRELKTDRGAPDDRGRR